MRVELLPADAHNQRTITQGHPSKTPTRVVLLGGGGLAAARHLGRLFGRRACAEVL